MNMVSFIQKLFYSMDETLIVLVIGIELGRSYNRVAVFRNYYTFEIIADERGRSKIPSYVAFPELAAPLIGFEAKSRVDGNLKNTIYDIR